MKTLTTEQRTKQREKEQKEIEKWEREKARPRGKNYVFYLMLMMSIVYVTDEVASQIGTQMKAEIALNLFANRVSLLETLSLVGIVAVVFTIFYKPLSDRYGRKLVLIINTLGMGVGMFLIFLSNNIPLYITGALMIGFFVPHDVQVVYILESSPAKHRAKIYAIIKAVATLGVLLIPLFRRIFMKDTANWNMVYLIPAIIGIVVALAALFLARESDSFIEHRLTYLRMTDEERAAAKQAKDAAGAQGGIGPALKYAFSHKQLKWLMIISMLVFMGALITQNYQIIMSHGYAKSLLAAGTFTDLEQAIDAAGVGPVTTALFMFPISSALFQLIPGFLADGIGRKPTTAITAATAIVCFTLFFIGSANNWSPYLIGLLCGAFVGSYWATTDVAGGMMISESSPTNLRASILAVQGMMTFIVLVPIMILNPVLIGIFGNDAIPYISLFVGMPGMILALIFLLTKTHDTKGVDLDKVTGAEWD